MTNPLARLGRRLFTLLLTACLAAPAFADPVTHRLASRHLGAERSYQVQLPADYATSGARRYPLLVVLDGERLFGPVSATVRFLAREGEIPEPVVVGVASGKRVHDYTQTDWPQGWIGGGGAAKFKRFVADELLPALARDHRLSGERLLLAHSAAGQFALHLLATESALFDAYLLLSPGLDWDGRLPVRELQAALSARERLPAFVYIAEDGALGSALDDQLALRQVLQDQAPRGLQWLAVAYPKETHGSIVLQGTIDALRARYHGHRLHPDDAPLLAERASVLGVDALGQRYALLARQGRAAEIPEEAFHAVAEAHLRRREPQAAVELLRRAVAAFPGSAESREALADALKRLAAPAPPPR